MSWKEEFDNKFGLNGLHAKPCEYMKYEDVSEEVKQFISDTIKKTKEEIISYIGHNEGWEETEDIYREHFGLKTKYK